MSPFKSDKQRKGFYSQQPKVSRNKPPQSPPPKPPSMGNGKNSILSKIPVSDVLMWTGCSLAPNECLVIKCVNKAYKMYKQDSLNKYYDNKIENIVEHGLSKFTTAVAEDEISNFTNEIVNQVNDSGLIDEISKKTNLNKLIIKDIIEGTTSNLLRDTIETGTGFVVRNEK